MDCEWTLSYVMSKYIFLFVASECFLLRKIYLKHVCFVHEGITIIWLTFRSRPTTRAIQQSGRHTDRWSEKYHRRVSVNSAYIHCDYAVDAEWNWRAQLYPTSRYSRVHAISQWLNAQTDDVQKFRLYFDCDIHKYIAPWGFSSATPWQRAIANETCLSW